MKSYVERAASRRKIAESRRRESLRSEARRLAKLLEDEGFVFLRVYLWGSTVRNKPLSPWSDIDLVIEGLAPELFFKAYASVLKKTGHPVDLIPLEEMEEAVRDKLEREGEVIYEKR